MGNFYKNITTFGPAQAELAALLKRYERHAYITPTRNRITVLFDRRTDEQGDPQELGDLALTVSLELSCPALAAAVYDDDVLLLGLYNKGEQLGEYSSDGESTLSAGVLARVFQSSGSAPLIWSLLNSPRMPLFLFESFRHRLLLRLLRHPLWAYATGYRYIAQGEPPLDINESELIHIEGTLRDEG